MKTLCQKVRHLPRAISESMPDLIGHALGIAVYGALLLAFLLPAPELLIAPWLAAMVFMVMFVVGG